MSNPQKRKSDFLVESFSLVIVIALAAVFFAQEIRDRSQVELRNPALGRGKLISVQPLPAIAGEMCQWIPASASTTLAARLREETTEDAKSGVEGSLDFSKRKPVRMIRDPYAAYSSVAVDPANNEVVLTDENLFNILAYNRLDNTPPQAKMTEPKRILGGLHTKIEFQCGLYIDPQNGDIYAVNNDTVDRLVIFSRRAKGDVPPDREIHTPHGTFGIAMDEEHQELMLTVQHDSAVVTYHKDAKNEDSPIRLLQGDHTLLADPHGMAFDAKHDLIFVTNHGAVHQKIPADKSPRRSEKENWPLGPQIPGSGKNTPPSITVYPRTASGDVAPLRVIQGPKTQMDWPTGVAYDPRTDEIFIANDMGNSILVFPATANGDVAPVRVLKGSKSHIKNPTGVYIDVEHDEMWVSNFGNHSATVYHPSASGDPAPLRIIRSGPAGEASLGIGNPHPVAYDSKREEILVPNCVAHPQIATFARLTNGDIQPVRRIEGQQTMLGRTMHAISYDPIHDEVVVPQQFGQAILTFKGGTNGEVPPVRVIQGSLSQLRSPDHLDVDPVHNEIFVPEGDHILVYPREGNGNIAPIRILGGPGSHLAAGMLSVDPVHNLLVVGGRNQGSKGVRLMIFNRTAEGDAKPLRVISGPKTGLIEFGGPFALYPPKNEILVSVRGTDDLEAMYSDDCFVGVWSTMDDGNVPWRMRLGGPKGVLQMVRGVAVDAKHKSLIVTDKRLNAVLTFYFPEIF